MAEFIGVKSYKAKGKRLTSFTVDNITELEPVVKKESVTTEQDKEEDEKEESLSIPDDPAQMKLEI